MYFTQELLCLLYSLASCLDPWFSQHLRGWPVHPTWTLGSKTLNIDYDVLIPMTGKCKKEIIKKLMFLTN